VVDSTVGPDANVYVLDWNNHRVVTFDPPDEKGECDTLRVVTGTTLLGDGPEGDALAASWNHPTNLAFGPDGRMVMAAWHNSRVVGVDLEESTCAFLAGTGARSFSGDGGLATAAELDLPAGVVFDDEGLLYIADQANQRVRRIDADGMISSIVGTGENGYNGDGIPASEAMLFNELSQAAHPSGKLDIAENQLYIADTGNHRVRVVDLGTGVIETFAGTGEAGFSGDGGDPVDAQLNAPRDVEVGADGAIYIADTANHCVRVVRSGAISTVAGICGEPGYEGDRGPAPEARLNEPYGVETDAAGTLYIADSNNHALRTVTPAAE
jgi:DNA-binding beta-propeller fold protein YncE